MDRLIRAYNLYVFHLLPGQWLRERKHKYFSIGNVTMSIFGFFNIEIQMSTISETIFLQFLRNYMFRIQINMSYDEKRGFSVSYNAAM